MKINPEGVAAFPSGFFFCPVLYLTFYLTFVFFVVDSFKAYFQKVPIFMAF